MAKFFEELEIWMEARQLVNVIYKNTISCKDYGFKDQIQRASVSVMNNIAEGFERNSNAEFIRFLNIALGSCGEVRSMSYIAFDLNYFQQETVEVIKESSLKISRKISSLIKYLENNKVTKLKVKS